MAGIGALGLGKHLGAAPGGTASVSEPAKKLPVWGKPDGGRDVCPHPTP